MPDQMIRRPQQIASPHTETMQKRLRGYLWRATLLPTSSSSLASPLHLRLCRSPPGLRRCFRFVPDARAAPRRLQEEAAQTQGGPPAGSRGVAAHRPVALRLIMSSRNLVRSPVSFILPSASQSFFCFMLLCPAVVAAC